MNGTINAMMGWMSVFGWLGALLLLVLLIASIVALVRLVRPQLGTEKTSGLKILVIVLAVIGAFAVAGGVAMLLMHWGMGGMMGRC